MSQQKRDVLDFKDEDADVDGDEVGEIQGAREVVAADYIALRPLLAGESIQLRGEAAGAVWPRRPALGSSDQLDPREPVLLGKSALAGWDLGALKLAALQESFPELQLVLRGTDDEGDPVRVSCGSFIRYMLAQDELEGADEEPLAVFDAEILYSCLALSALYVVPDVGGLQLRAGLFERLPIVLQPPLRWLILGPLRTGTVMHQDPEGTSAWNVVTHGRKRWAMLCPAVPAELALRQDPPKDTAWTMAGWFQHEWPRICADATAAGWAALDFEQTEGELLYVPPGWWHAALNVEGSVAITHNCLQAEPLREIVKGAGAADIAIEVFKLCRDRGRLFEPMEDDGAVRRWLGDLQAEGLLPM